MPSEFGPAKRLVIVDLEATTSNDRTVPALRWPLCFMVVKKMRALTDVSRGDFSIGSALVVPATKSVESVYVRQTR